MFEKLDQYLEYFSVTVVTVATAAATLAAFINVVLRYMFNASLTWAAEQRKAWKDKMLTIYPKFYNVIGKDLIAEAIAEGK